jgi:hypothetical protein
MPINFNTGFSVTVSAAVYKALMPKLYAQLEDEERPFEMLIAKPEKGLRVITINTLAEYHSYYTRLLQDSIGGLTV